ncbi:hypothetical protein ZWY2020_025119 [Hordeum vulgare]|nr:hypothetical protein ZWY2020_025119 [Hordeum vulgare]
MYPKNIRNPHIARLQSKGLVLADGDHWSATARSSTPPSTSVQDGAPARSSWLLLWPTLRRKLDLLEIKM